MMLIQFVGPIIASLLYVIVFQKAGFGGGMLALCAAPVLGVGISYALVQALMAGGSAALMILVPLVSIPLTLLPLLILAFKPWPPVAAPQVRPEN